VQTDKLSSYSFEMGPIRPPSEGGSCSLLIRLTRNCPWSRCKFCYATFYEREKFQLRSFEEIKKDIQSVKAISQAVEQASLALGFGGEANDAVGSHLLRAEPELGQNYSFIAVFNWMLSGGRTAFLQDADSLIMRTPDLIQAVSYLKETFPSLQRLTSYARSKTLCRKTAEELSSIRRAGLNRLHVGLETGDDELLALIDKGVTAAEHIAAGTKAKAAGFEFSAYIMPGLGGRKLSAQHAANTARVLNAVNPDYIRSRPYVPRPGTPLFEEYQAGAFELTSPHERLKELRALVADLNVESHLCFDHMMNGWRQASGALLFRQDYEGYQFPREKAEVLSLIEQGLSVDESKHVDARDLIKLERL
jgi:radical SAM superfamily enzyme YgiQ (UPF0313 family)